MSKQRPENSAILGVSMPLALKQRIKRLADADDRTMASWAAIHLKRVVQEIEAASEFSTVADSGGNESSHSTHAVGAKAVKYPAARKRKSS